MPYYPAYLNSYHSGKLDIIARELFLSLSSCDICPRGCKVDRLKGGRGFCKSGVLPEIFSYMVHHGEEPPISGTKGSGTIFFSHCNMSCAYCQNYEFSQMGKGRKYGVNQLAQVMLQLQKLGCHNINLVTPTHFLPQILRSLQLAAQVGLKIPLVYNTSGYETSEVIRLLDGIVDIYLADSRYGDDLAAGKISKAPDYVRFNRASLKEMQRQVGVAQFDEEGLIRKGLIVRHLVLPGGVSRTAEVMRFIAEEISADTYVSLMSQYLPYYLAGDHPEINRRLRKEEYRQARDILEEYGLLNGWVQESYGQERFAGVHIRPR
jgi:putative pyruvate formate lyase activating enzyme